MNKPNGISDKVWEMAKSAMLPPVSYDLVVERIALAISKSIEDEREACAQLVDPIQTDDRMSDHEKHAFDLRDILSQEIRNRSKGQE